MTTGALAFVLVAVVAQSQAAKTTPPSSPAKIGIDCRELRDEVDRAVTWCPADAERPAPSAVQVADIARRFAPILWFSPNEPLLWSKPGEIPPDCNLAKVGVQSTIGIPHALPWEAPAGGPVVYYQIVEYDGTPGAVTADRVDLTQVRRLELRYFLYYRCDIGANPHPDDLEGVQMKLSVETESGCRRLRLAQVTGQAHGLRWVYNRLNTPADLIQPVTILVEEGKHASCPDRNGDGGYTPGYDVNVSPKEAWGVRDNFGSGLILAKYSGEDTKRRDPRHRVYPADLAAAEDPLRRFYDGCSVVTDQWADGEQESTHTTCILGDGSEGSGPEQLRGSRAVRLVFEFGGGAF